MCRVKEGNINVRLDPDLKGRVDKAAESLGMNPSALMRTLLARFVEHCERHGGRIVMPPEFTEYEIVQRASRDHAKAAESRTRYGKK